MPGTI